MERWILVFIDAEGCHDWLGYDTEEEAIKNVDSLKADDVQAIWLYAPNNSKLIYDNPNRNEEFE